MGLTEQPAERVAAGGRGCAPGWGISGLRAKTSWCLLYFFSLTFNKTGCRNHLVKNSELAHHTLEQSKCEGVSGAFLQRPRYHAEPEALAKLMKVTD